MNDVEIRAVGDVGLVHAALQDFPNSLRSRLPGDPVVSPLSQDSEEHDEVFGKSNARARTAQTGVVYLNTLKTGGLADLRVLLFHELAHVAQFASRKPLVHPSWNWLFSTDHYSARAMRLLRRQSRRAKMELPAGAQPRPEHAARFSLLFADVDANTFMINEGVVSLEEYSASVPPYLSDLRTNSHGHSLEETWNRVRSSGVSTNEMIRNHSINVLYSWLDLVGGRWARLAPLLGTQEGEQIAEQFVAQDWPIFQEEFGRFIDEDLFAQSWRALAAAGESDDAIWDVWSGVAGAAVDAVKRAHKKRTWVT